MNRILVSFAPHMFRDYLVTRGGGMAAIAAVFVGPTLLGFAQVAEPNAEQMHIQAVQLMGMITPFLTLIAVYGLIGQDFREGFYRPMFAKPVSVPLYYAQLFCCAVLCFWIVQGLVLLAFAVYGVNAWEPTAWLDFSMRFFLLGTLTFAISRVSRLDWLFAMFFFSLASPLRQGYPAAESLLGWLINVLFPPTQLFDLLPAARAQGQFSALVAEVGLEWGSIGWVAGYSAVCFLIGIWAVRRIPLASVQ